MSCWQMFANGIFLLRPESFAPRLLGVALCVLLSACATTRPSVDLPPLTTWELRQSVLSTQSDWAFRGRIAVKSDDDGFNGKFNWTQTGQSFYATVSGPLGIGTVEIEGDESAIVITDKDGVKTPLVDAEVELYQRYGWTIPVTSLRYWALGIPHPQIDTEPTVDGEGRMTHLTQGDWDLNISRYREYAGQQMPRTITVTNPATRVRMVIDKWTFYE